jgi:polysaccharide export outer membrane protein
VAASDAGVGSLPPPDAPGAYETEYPIAPLDQLDVSVFQVPDLTRSVQVDASGQVVLPLIGSISAAGKTVRELETDIAAQLGAKYLQSPQVTVVLKDSPTHRITVEGAVNSPGIFPLTARTTLIQAVALSGGLDDVANAGDVTIFRTVQNQRMAATFSVNSIRAGKAADPEVFGGDVIVVGESARKAALREFGRVLPVLGIFSPL